MEFKHRVIPAAGKNAETLERELNEAGDQGFHVVAVTGRRIGGRRW